ncbi:MAG: protein kinase [Planctomycetota bacterium]|nr:protein kinase [Planctomycetota bacterium]
MNSAERHIALVDAALGMGLLGEEDRDRLLKSEQPPLRQLVDVHGIESTDIIRLLAHTYRQDPPSQPSNRDRVSTVHEERPDPLEGRTALGPYRILEELGRGGMGIVYKAHQIVLDRFVALKVIQATGDAQHPKMARFRREALAAARLSHPNILRVYDLGYTDGVYFLAMELIEGYPLDLYMSDLGRDPRVIIPIVSTIASALEYAHQQGVIHRDVKPSNILIDGRGTPFLADFGVAKLIGEHAPLISTRLGSLVGTVQYMSPEQLLGQHPSVDVRTDIYALGVTLYELLTHRLPYDPHQERNPTRWDEAPPPSQFNPAVNHDLDQINLKALHLRLGARYRSVEDFRNDLQRYLHGEPISLSTSRTHRYSFLAFKWLNWKPIGAGMFLGLILGLAVCLSLFSSSRSPTPTNLLSNDHFYSSARRSAGIVDHLSLYGLERAINELERIAREEPDNPWIPLNLARLRWRESDRKNARSLLHAMKAPRLPEAVFLLGLDALLAGQPERALPYALKLGDSGNGTWSLCAEAQIAWSRALESQTAQGRQQNLDRADRILQDILEEEPDFEPALLLRQEMLVQRGKWKAVHLLLQQRLRLRPEGHDLICRQGELLLERKEWTQARRQFDRALKLIPSSVRARIGRARSWYAPEQLPRALREIDHALEIDPSRTDAWIARAWIRDSLENFQSALQDFQQAQSLAPNDPIVLISRAKLCLRRGQQEQAMKDLQKALTVAPAAPHAHACLGEVHLARSQYEKARTSFRRAQILQDNRSVRVQAALGATRALSGELEKGLKILDATLLEDDDDPRIHAWLGQIHFARDSFNDARNHLNRAVRLDSRCPDYYLLRAQVRKAIGKHSEARSDRKRAQELMNRFEISPPKPPSSPSVPK